LALLVLPFWKLCERTGFSGWFSLVIFVPFIGLLGLAYIIAFSHWTDPSTSKKAATKDEWLAKAKKGG
jgi:uncharacterized membrane protein YhaH (DUF805 family)